MRRHDHNILTNAASLLVCGLLAGVVVAAAAFPAIAMSGLAAKTGARTFDKLPTELFITDSPQISHLFAADGKTLIAMMYDENRRNITLADVPAVMREAIIAAEDHDFFKHNGVDIKGIARAFVANRNAGATQQGASTLTMQYVRLAISYSASPDRPHEVVAATEDTNARKLREIRYAMAVEKQMTKEEILERYLNIAYFGNGAYGIFAASQVYFGKPPKDLKVEEAALLAGLVKSPTTYNPTTEGGYPQAVDRRNWVLGQMKEIGALTEAETAAASATKLTVKGKRAPNGCVATIVAHHGFFCDFFYRWWMDQEAFGATSYDRERRLRSGGYNIITSLDVKAQAAAKKHVDESMKGQPKWAALMLNAIEPGTGQVRAMATNRNFKLDDPDNPKNGEHTNPVKRRAGIRGTYPNTTNPLMSGGGDITGYQGGSTFKLFTMLAALEQGYPLDYTIRTVPKYTTKYVIEPGGEAACGNKWCPSNDSGGGAGVFNMWTGFGSSINTFFAPLIERAGADKAVDVAQRLGIKFRAGSDANLAKNAESWGSFTLGVMSTVPLDLANAYASIAADGVYCEPIPVQEIRDLSGAKLDVANPRCRKALDPQVARAAIDAARCPVGDQSAYGECRGTTFRMAKQIVGKYNIFGKTGTSDGARTKSLIVGTKSLVVGAMLADPDWAQHEHSFTVAQIQPAVARTLRDAMAGKPNLAFAKPDRKYAYGTQVAIPDVRCQDVGAAAATLRSRGFDVSIDSQPVNSNCPKGTVAGTNPSGRTIKGGVVILEISNGATTPVTPPGPGGGGGPDRTPCRLPLICPPPND